MSTTLIETEPQHETDEGDWTTIVTIPKGEHLHYKGISVVLAQDTPVVSDILAKHGTPDAYRRHIEAWRKWRSEQRTAV